jgi:phosphoribosylglycinamide formyltransferase-1
MVTPINLAIIISGRGSNLQSIIDACQDENFPARIKLVISNEPGVYGIERAQAAGIPTEIVHHKLYPSRREFEEALSESLKKYTIDLICLAGFMRVLTPDFVSKWEGKMLNIHPSLLPAYPGLHTHERVLAAGEKESGCTVHFVTPGLDEGPTLLQKRVQVMGNDTPDTLAARILEQEHIAYPEAIRLIALGKVTYGKEHVAIASAEPYIPPQKKSEPAPVTDVKPPVAQPKKEAEKMSNNHAHQADNAPDDAAIAEANAIWSHFTKATVITIVGVTAILALMAITLL